MFASSDKALLVVQLSTLLFGNSFTASTLSLQNMRVENHQSLDHKVFRHEYPPQSTIGREFSFAQPYLAGRLVGGTTGEPAVDWFLHFCILLLLSHVGQPFSRVACYGCA